MSVPYPSLLFKDESFFRTVAKRTQFSEAACKAVLAVLSELFDDTVVFPQSRAARPCIESLRCPSFLCLVFLLFVASFFLLCFSFWHVSPRFFSLCLARPWFSNLSPSRCPSFFRLSFCTDSLFCFDNCPCFNIVNIPRCAARNSKKLNFRSLHFLFIHRRSSDNLHRSLLVLRAFCVVRIRCVASTTPGGAVGTASVVDSTITGRLALGMKNPASFVEFIEKPLGGCMPARGERKLRRA